MKRIVLLLCGVLAMPFMAVQLFAKERPAWVKGFFTERPNSYVEVVSATGYSEDNAREKAALIIVERRSFATGQRVQISINDDNISIDGSDALTVKARIIDQYTERLGAGVYRVSLLVQTAKNPEFEYEPVTVTRNYGFSPSVFVPGAAQFHKGQKARGIFFISGEVVLIGGALATEIFCKVSETELLSGNNKYLYDASDLNYYANAMTIGRTVRNGCLIGAAALYVWNVIDGVASKGKSHIVIGKSSSIDFVPYRDNMSSGLMLSLTF